MPALYTVFTFLFLGLILTALSSYSTVAATS